MMADPGLGMSGLPNLNCSHMLEPDDALSPQAKLQAHATLIPHLPGVDADRKRFFAAGSADTVIRALDPGR
jgi:hypothetical protein